MANDTSPLGWKLRTRNKLSAYWAAPDHVAASHAYACDRNEQRHPTAAQRQQREHAKAGQIHAPL